MKKKTKIIAFVASAILTIGVLKATVKRPPYAKHIKMMQERHKSCDKAAMKQHHSKDHHIKSIEE